MLKVDNPRILVMCLADVSTNPRPQRMVSLCRKSGFSVDVAGFLNSGHIDCEEYHYFSSPCQKIRSRIERKILRAISVLFHSDWALQLLNERRWGENSVQRSMRDRVYKYIIVHDPWLLPLAFKLKKSAKIVFDAREYYPGEVENNLLWRIFDRPEKVRVCRRYMPKCDSIMTVSQGIVDRYRADFDVQCKLVRSAPYFYDCGVVPVSPEKIRMVHHGGANRDRKLENMIDMFSMLDDRFTLDFYLTGSVSYKEELKKRASGQARVRFLDPVPFNQILPMLQNYDIGLYLLEPTGFNTEYALPNKFFEFIQARLMLAIGPSPDMAALLREYDCGIVSDDFKPQTMARILNRLTPEAIMQKKMGSDRAAHDLCFEKESQKITSILQSLGVQ